MFDIPGHPELDKATLVGGCVRLPLAVDGGRLRWDVDGLPASVWGSAGGRVGSVRLAEAVFLRGCGREEGDKPVDDRPALQYVPYVREIIETLIPAPPMRCLLARLPAGAVVGMHVDTAPYFSKTLRLHIAVTTHESAWMMAGGLVYHMRPGEVWALDNSGMHGVWNADEAVSRKHLVCDFLPTTQLLALLAGGVPGTRHEK